MSFGGEQPLIIQSDRTLLLETGGPRYEEARDHLARFAELVKSPEQIHTYKVTPLSLLRAVAIIAVRGNGTDLDPRHLDRIAEGMEEAAQGGTLAALFKNRDVAAKTGTAKKQGGGTRALVVGFFPASRPKYAFVVVRNEGRGAVDAGPIAAQLVEDLSR